MRENNYISTTLASLKRLNISENDAYSLIAEEERVGGRGGVIQAILGIPALLGSQIEKMSKEGITGNEALSNIKKAMSKYESDKIAALSQSMNS